AVIAEAGDHVFQFRVFAGQIAETALLADHLRRGQQAGEFLVAFHQPFEFVPEAVFHAEPVSSESGSSSRSSSSRASISASPRLSAASRRNCTLGPCSTLFSNVRWKRRSTSAGSAPPSSWLRLRRNSSSPSASTCSR